MSQGAVYLRIKPVKLVELQACPQEAASLLSGMTTAGGQMLDIDRSWQALHFILRNNISNEQSPLRTVIIGDTMLEDPSMDYAIESPIMFFTQQDVQRKARAFEDFPAHLFETCIQSSVLQAARIPPSSLWENDRVARSYLTPYYSALATFFQDSAQAGDAMLTRIL